MGVVRGFVDLRKSAERTWGQEARRSLGRGRLGEVVRGRIWGGFRYGKGRSSKDNKPW